MRVWINMDGQYYKADLPYHPNDCEKNLPTPEMLAALTDQPVSQHEFFSRIALFQQGQLTDERLGLNQPNSTPAG